MLKLEINVGTLCNFRCSYCHENGDDKEYIPFKLSFEHLMRYAEYVIWFKENVAKEEDICICVYGGEPFLRLEDIQKFTRVVDPYIFITNIITNASLVNEKLDILKQMREENQSRLNVIASYDYAFQNETRHPGSYDTVRDGIRILYNNGFTTRTISVFNAKNIYRIDDVFFDFVKLHYELPLLQSVFNLDRFGPYFTSVDIDRLRKSLSHIQAFMRYHPEMKSFFKLNDNMGRTRQSTRGGNFFGGISCALYHDGNVYPGYEIPHSERPEFVKILHLGHINDSFEEIEKKRIELISKLPKNLPEKCQTCGTTCRMEPWRTVRNSLSEWDGIPKDPSWCKIRGLLDQYLL